MSDTELMENLNKIINGIFKNIVSEKNLNFLKTEIEKIVREDIEKNEQSV